MKDVDIWTLFTHSELIIKNNDSVLDQKPEQIQKVYSSLEWLKKVESQFLPRLGYSVFRCYWKNWNQVACPKNLILQFKFNVSTFY